MRSNRHEDGGLGGQGAWEPTKTGFTPGHENDFMNKYLRGETLETKA